VRGQLAGVPARRGLARAGFAPFLTMLAALAVATGVLSLAPGAAGASTPARPLASTLNRPLASTPARPLAWSAPVSLEKPPFAAAEQLASVSCASASFCAVSDIGGGVLTSVHPAAGLSSWSARASAGGSALSLDCPASTFCAGLSSGAGVWTSTAPGGARPAWRESLGGYSGRSLSCPSSRLCVVSGADGELISSAAPAGPRPAWHVIHVTGTTIWSVSCPTTSFCGAAAGGAGVLTASHPAAGKKAWKLTKIDGAALLLGITCPSARFCLARDSLGRFLYSTDPAGGASRWHLVTEPADGGSVLNVSCQSAAFCAAIDGDGIATTSNPAGGAAAWQQDDDLVAGSLSCTGPAFCAAISQTSVAISTRPASSAPGWSVASPDGVTQITVVDCVQPSLCLAADALGRVFAATNPAGGAGAWTAADIDPGGAITGISCPASTFCAAVDSGGGLFTSADPAGGASAWQHPGAPAGLSGLTCLAADSCIALDSAGLAITTDPAGGASAWTQVGAPVAFDGLSCPSLSLCFATTAADALYVSRGPAAGASSWSALSFGQDTIGLPVCPSSSRCIAPGNLPGNDGVEGPPLIFTSTDPGSGVTHWNVSRAPGAGSLVCPAVTRCYLGGPGSRGYLRTSADPFAARPTWSTSAAPRQLSAFSCATVSFCAGGYSAAYGGAIVTARPGLLPTSTSLALSRPTIADGHEGRERLTVTVTPRYGAPPGRIVVQTGRRTLCSASLAALSGAGSRASCNLARSELAPGTYRLSARYPGSAAFAASRSARELLHVTR
jgi:hypothetical protein